MALASTSQIVRPIPDYVKTFLGKPSDWSSAATSYYRIASPWLPIVSRRKVFDQLLNPLLSLRIDAVFLLLYMKLVTTSQQGQTLEMGEYYAAVRFRTDIHCTGIISLEVLQGCILLSVYEQAHAVYPAAFISLGICVQHATALGMSWLPLPADPDNTSLQNMEEQRRTWWAIFMLERYESQLKPCSHWS